MADPLLSAVKALQRGELVVYPTDTLWGLGARATDRKAVARLFEAKGRPTDAPVSVLLSSLEEVEPLSELHEAQRAFLRRHLPGPFTAVLPPSPWARKRLSPLVLGPKGQIAVRIPDHPLARELARRVGPLTATSANLHGQPTELELDRVKAALGPSVAVYLDGEPAPHGSASRVVDLTGPVPVVLRE